MIYDDNVTSMVTSLTLASWVSGGSNHKEQVTKSRESTQEQKLPQSLRLERSAWKQGEVIKCKNVHSFFKY